jgi:hypothetical protein
MRRCRLARAHAAVVPKIGTAAAEVGVVGWPAAKDIADRRWQMGADSLTTFMPILLACLSYIFTTFHTLRSEQHRNLVERVSQQLHALYGPLLACITASKSSYEAMISHLNAGPGKSPCSPAAFRAAIRSNPDGEAAAAYRMWVKTVLMPLSVKAADIIIARADLLEGTSIEPLLLQLVAHVSACALHPAPPRFAAALRCPPTAAVMHPPSCAPITLCPQVQGDSPRMGAGCGRRVLNDALSGGNPSMGLARVWQAQEEAGDAARPERIHEGWADAIREQIVRKYGLSALQPSDSGGVGGT